MRILFLVPYPVDEAPSQRFRFEQYFELLRENKISFSVSSFWSINAWKILYKPGHQISKAFWLVLGFLKRWIDVFKAIRYDLIFIHRECTPIGPPIFEFIIAKLLRKKIIYDFDDAIWLENTSRENKIVRFLKFHTKVKSICRWSFKVSCGNEWLGDYARQFNSNVVINPTTIDTDSLHIPKEKSKDKSPIVIGWTGTHSTISYLNEILPVLKELESKYPIQIKIISNKNPKLDLQSFEFVSWNKENEVQQLAEFDIGIMPLTDDAWSKGKCGFKALQYMAMEIPCVVSPVGVNSKIISNGVNGYLCEVDSCWLQTLENLINDSLLRKEIGKKGRSRVIDSYSVSSNSSNFLGLTKL